MLKRRRVRGAFHSNCCGEKEKKKKKNKQKDEWYEEL